MTQLRLSYLPFRAMAETTRFMLRHGNIAYQDEVVWGTVFANRRARGEYPFEKVPIMDIDGRIVAQSGSIARYVAKLAGCYPEDAAECAFNNDAIFEMGQELCSINPISNCYTGKMFAQYRGWYFSTLPGHLVNLERQLQIATANGSCEFFGGDKPTYADYNIYHHLNMARLLEPDCVPKELALHKWMAEMEAIPSLRDYLAERPTLVGMGEDPGLVDKNGRFLAQRHPEGRAILRNGVFDFAAD
eukprot:CAMPEP_0178448124 /NCGR_PEP_ID=MMETSP0689_2-20121128/41800_1 /TAXON_ID=160604 /ORGANISM="Amphidinium massartii, Strain CS-259" /LENGTH=244 /DNA_ID=CAMNT_0020073255 /DNA_START=1 /DNA_END=735 /DNA_ORIENTATION=+